VSVNPKRRRGIGTPKLPLRHGRMRHVTEQRGKLVAQKLGQVIRTRRLPILVTGWVAGRLDTGSHLSDYSTTQVFPPGPNL